MSADRPRDKEEEDLLRKEAERRGIRVSRRSALADAILGVGIIASLVAFFYPIIEYMIPPKTANLGANEVVAAKVGELKPNTGKIFRFGERPGLLVFTEQLTYIAMTAVCTHLGCTVQYRNDLRLVWCPCHNGRYDPTGRVVSGPPPRPLQLYEVAVRGDKVFVRRV